jgi:hypothetical protein
MLLIRNSRGYLALALSVQIIIGIICGSLTLYSLYFRAPYRDFDRTASRIKADLHTAIPPTLDPHGDMAGAIVSTIDALHSEGIAIVCLQLVSSAALLILSTVALLLLVNTTDPTTPSSK